MRPVWRDSDEHDVILLGRVRVDLRSSFDEDRRHDGWHLRVLYRCVFCWSALKSTTVGKLTTGSFLGVVGLL